jgi:hypothetical protein
VEIVFLINWWSLFFGVLFFVFSFFIVVASLGVFYRVVIFICSFLYM